MLSREHHGPRAVLNALERLASSYGSPCATVRQDLAIAETRLRDFKARLGASFAHDSYLSQLAALRDQLRAGLSGATPEPGSEALPRVSELAEQIKALKAGNTVEAAHARVGKPRSTAEEPVTSRIRRRTEGIPAADSAVSPDTLDGSSSEPNATAAPAKPSLPPESPAIPAHHTSTRQDRSSRPKVVCQESVARGR
jgi:hypothetical protein